MPSVSGRVKGWAVIALVAPASIATHYAFDYSSAKNTVVEAAITTNLLVPLARPTANVTEALSLNLPVTRRHHLPAAVDTVAAVAPVAVMPGARTVPQQAVASPPMPYTHAGFIEEGGARMAVLALGNFLLAKNLGERVDDEFQLTVLDPPALLHLPTGAVLPVPRPPNSEAPPRSTRRMVASAAQTNAAEETISAAEIEAEIAIALATPVPEPIVPSSFPLAR